MSNKKKVRS